MSDLTEGQWLEGNYPDAQAEAESESEDAEPSHRVSGEAMTYLRDAIDRFTLALPLLDNPGEGAAQYRDDARAIVEVARKYANLDTDEAVPAWKGKWDDTDPDDWETWTLWAHGSEAGDWRPATGQDVLAALGVTEDE